MTDVGKVPRKPVEYSESDIPAAEWRRQYGSLIKQKLEELRCAWETARDPGAVVNAMWLTNTCQYPRPPWLRKVVAKFPSDKITLDIDKTDIKGWRYVTDNGDIGKHVGPHSAKKHARAKAREMLEAGWSGTKTALSEHISKWLKSQYHHFAGDPLPAELHMHPDRVAAAITPEWQEFRPDRACVKSKQKI